MKQILSTIFLSIILLCAVNNAEAGNYKKIKIQTSALCEMCKSKIEASLVSVNGVKSAFLDLHSKKVRIKYDPEILTEQDLKNLISNIGYMADEIMIDVQTDETSGGCCDNEGFCIH